MPMEKARHSSIQGKSGKKEGYWVLHGLLCLSFSSADPCPLPAGKIKAMELVVVNPNVRGRAGEVHGSPTHWPSVRLGQRYFPPWSLVS